jgi:hypothetical protein
MIELRQEDTPAYAISYAPQTKLLIKFLKGGKPGDIVTDAQLREVAGVGVSPGDDGYGYLSSAKKHCERANQVVWHRVRGEGKLVCLNSKGIISLNNCDIHSIRRKTRRTASRIECVQIGELDDNEKREVRTQQAILGSIAMFTKPSMQKEIAQSASLFTPSKDDIKKLFAATTEPKP